MKKTISLLLILAIALSLCACGGTAASKTAESPAYDGYDAYVTSEAADWGEDDWANDEDAAYGLSSTRSGSGDAPAERPGKIIYSANVQVETTDFDLTLQKLDGMIERYGGWVESSSLYGSNYADRSRGNVSRRTASYTLRIPSDVFQELMGSLTELGNIPYSHVYTENVTAQYYDVQARLDAYKAQEKRLLEMMEMAETVEDIIILEDRLTEVRYQIESLQSTLNNWDRQVSYSTVYLEIAEVQEYSPEPQVQPSFGQRLLSSLQSGLRGLLLLLEELLFLLAEALPTLLLIGVLVGIPLVLVRKKLKKRRAQKAAPAAPALAPAPAPDEEQT